MSQGLDFRSKSKLRPFYSLLARITAEELGHLELVSNGVPMLNAGPDAPEAEKVDLLRRTRGIAEEPTNSE